MNPESPKPEAPAPEPLSQASFGSLIREHLLPYNTLFALSGVVAFILGLVSPLLVIGFGTALLSLGLLIAIGNAFRKDAIVAWASQDTDRHRGARAFARYIWPHRQSLLRKSGLFWVIVGMGIAVTLYGATGVLEARRPAGRAAGEATPGTAARVEDRGPARILVLPFSAAASSGDRDALFAEGITNDVSSGLSRFSALRVMGRTTANAIHASNLDHAALRERYGIRYVLTGAFRRLDDKFRLNLELVETGAGTTVWSERVDAPMTQVLDVHDRVVRSTVGRVASQVMSADLRGTLESSPSKLSAYELTLRARQLWRKANRETLPEAQGLLARAIAADPSYAPAHAYLAFTNLTSYNNSWAEGFSKVETLQLMLANASKALELEPSNGTAEGAKATALAYLGRHDEAVASARKALAVNGSDPDVLARVGQVLSFSGEHEEAVAVLKTAVDLDPLGPGQLHNFLSRAYFMLKNYDEAASHARICLERAGIEPCWETLAAALALSNRPRDAASAWQMIVKKRGDIAPSALTTRLGRAFKRRDDIDHLVAGLSRAREAARQDSER